MKHYLAKNRRILESPTSLYERIEEILDYAEVDYIERMRIEEQNTRCVCFEVYNDFARLTVGIDGPPYEGSLGGVARGELVFNSQTKRMFWNCRSEELADQLVAAFAIHGATEHE